MKKAYLIATMLILPATSLFAQGQSEIDLLKARIDVQERRISKLEGKLIQLAGKTAPAPKAIPIQEKKVIPIGQYEVIKGDTLSDIATKNKTTISAIKKANKLKTDSLNIGQKLRIPSSKLAKTPAGENSQAKKAKATKLLASSGVKKYRVKAGDTFYDIARRYNISEAALKAANPKASPRKLQVGQELLIDSTAKVKKTSVKKKQVSKKISAKIKTAPVKKISKSTPKSKSKSIAKAPKKKTASVPVSSKKTKGVRTITVDKQMTYGEFATQYGANTSELNKLNGLNLSKSTMLAKGSELYVPSH